MSCLHALPPKGGDEAGGPAGSLIPGLPETLKGGRRTSCSRRTRALEAVLLSAIPVNNCGRFGLALFFWVVLFGFKLGAVQHASTLRVFFSLVFRAGCESTYAVAAPSLDPNLLLFQPTHPVSGPLMVSGLHGLRITQVWAGPQLCPFLTTDPGLLVGRGHACHAMHALHAFARTRIVLPCSFTGGQRTSCSRRARALEAVLLLVKRTAAASDLLCFFGWSCLGSSLEQCNMP